MRSERLERLIEILLKARKKKQKIALCHGCFDGLHDGHLKLFKRAKKVADLVVVGIENDEYIRRVKGDRKPFYKLTDRIAMVVKTGFVDYVFVVPLGDYRIYRKIYKDLKPDYLVTAVDEVYKRKNKDAIETGIRVIAVKKS